jgi:pyridoxal 5'-phosphate synthase pdxS subunit
MQLGAEGVFVGSGIFKSENPSRTAEAIVQATLHYDNPKIIAEVSKGLGAPMRGIAAASVPEPERLAIRGW